MTYRYTKHVEQRMAERKIPKAYIEALLDEKSRKLLAVSARDPNVEVVMGVINKVSMVVFINSGTKAIITVRPMRKKEKIMFEEHSNG